MSQSLPAIPSQCSNCGASLSGEYCGQCGQSIKTPKRLFLSLVNEALENLFQLDSRAMRTLGQILFRPGLVSKNYLAGKRASYVHPLRFYIVTSIVFFIALTVINFVTNFNPDDPVTTQVTEEQKNPEVVEQKPNAADASSPESSQEETKQTADENTEVDQGTEEDDPVNIDISFLEGEQGQRVEAFFERQAEKARELALADPGELIATMLEIAPPLMFVFMPVLAMFIHMLFIGKGTFYAEHLIYVVYTHCFLFLALSISSISDAAQIPYFTPVISSCIFLWIPIYLVWALKTNYGLTAWGTIWRSIAIAMAYSLLLMFGTMAVVLIGLVTL